MNIKTGMKKKLFYAGFFFLLLGLTACEKKKIPFGEEFVEGHTHVVLIDTLTPQLSTYKLDSFITSGSGKLVLGSYSDPVFGAIDTRSYFQIGIPFISPTIPLDAIFDSLTLVLLPSQEYTGDTTIAQTITAHELTAPLNFAPEKTDFYNTASIPFDPAALGSKEFIPRPRRGDTLEIRLPDVKGNDLFAKLKNKAPEVTNLDNFLQYFKGIALQSSPSPSSLLGYKVSDSALCLRIYYRERGVEFTKNRVQFPVINAFKQFNQIIIDRTGTPLQGLPAHFPEIPAASLNHAAYLQYATGLFGKVTFPGLQNLLNLDKAGKILKAELVIKPLDGTDDDDNYPLPSILYLGVTDKNNSSGPLITTGSGAIQSGTLFIDQFNGENTNYTFDITSFLQEQIKINESIRNGLVIYSPSTSTFNRLIVGDETTGKSRIQLKIYYLVVD